MEKESEPLNLSDDKGPYRKGRELNKWGAGSRRQDAPGMFYSVPGPEGEEVFPIRNDGTEGRWRLGREKMLGKVATGDVIFEKRQDGTFIVYEKIRDTGPRFKQRIGAIVEKFTDMQEDLEKERKTMTRLWAKREEQIRGVVYATAGMYGDLQGIAGRSFQEIEGLEINALEDSSSQKEQNDDNEETAQ